ncbi:MAG: O-antigen ligase family protein, partial [Planctomycetota bacterium]
SLLWARGPVRWVGFALLGGAFFVMLATGARIAFLITVGAYSALMILLFVVAPKERVKAGLTRLLALAGLLAMGLFVYSVATDTNQRYAAGETKPWERPIRIFAEMVRGEREATDSRLDTFARFAENWKNSPFIGAGPANYNQVSGGHEIHNSYLNIFAEQGVLGLLAFGFWMLTAGVLARQAMRGAPRGEPRVIVYGFLAGCCLLLLYQVTVLGLRQRPLWFIAGLLICLPRVLLDLHLRRQNASTNVGGNGRFIGRLEQAPQSRLRAAWERPASTGIHLGRESPL